MKKPKISKSPRKRGRQVIHPFTAEITMLICERIADGESLRTICKSKGMPSKGVVFGWLGQYPDFADQYAHAREVQADSFADEITEIADRKGLDPNDKRVRIDARKWLAGKLRPKKYGEKLALVGGGPDDAPIRHISNKMTAKEASEEYARTINGKKD